MLVSDVYARVCSRFLEPYPPGLQSGIFTLNDFLGHFASVIEDFFERTGILKILCTEAVHAFISVYAVPDAMSHVENVFVSGRSLSRENLESLNEGVHNWRKVRGIPKSFLEDGLAPKQVELFPCPNYEGAPIPPTGANVLQSPETGRYFQMGDFFPAYRGLTLEGIQVPLDASGNPKSTWALGDTILGLPNSAVPYLSWGCLAKLFSDDSEAKDPVRAEFCAGRYQEGVALFSAIDIEKCLRDPEGAI
jgi:hypothetical protein